MRVVGKVGSNGKAFVVSLSKIPNVATQKAALFLADHCTEVLRILPKEGKIYIYSKLIDAELARFTAQGIELLPQAGKIEQVLFETTEEITDVNGKTGKLIVGKDAQGRIVLEIADSANEVTLPNNIAEKVTRIAEKSISKLVEKLNLGKFIKKIGDYEVYENGEVFYRTMSKEHYDELLRTNKIRATGETTTSPNMAFSEGYEGILVQFKVKRGTIEKLENIGIAARNNKTALKKHKNLKKDISPWNEKYARFKLEKGQVNIAFGKGEALKIFNDNILEFKFVKEIKK